MSTNTLKDLRNIFDFHARKEGILLAVTVTDFNFSTKLLLWLSQIVDAKGASPYFLKLTAPTEEVREVHGSVDGHCEPFATSSTLGVQAEFCAEGNPLLLQECGTDT